MSQRYIDGEKRHEIEEAKRQDIPVPKIAEMLHMDVPELCQLMGWPQWKEIPTDNMVEQPADYLWSVDRLQAQL